MFEPFADHLGLPGLLDHLDDALVAAKKLNALSATRIEAADVVQLIKDLVHIVASLNDFTTRERRRASARVRSLSEADLIQLRDVYTSTAGMVQECIDCLGTLQPNLEALVNYRETQRYSTDQTLEDQDWYREVFKRLRLHVEVIRILDLAINLLCRESGAGRNGGSSSETGSPSLLSTLNYYITSFSPKLNDLGQQNERELRNAIKVARAVALRSPTSLNRHFVVPRRSKAFYTGREQQMEKLEAAFSDTTYPGQKRFVVYGLSGSGKTELALRYAEDHRSSFWGVFFIDGSSKKNASASYSEIAQIGGCEPNANAAKDWLQRTKLPWLLIIDNADDPEVVLDELLPAGTGGSILVTTRNPAHMVQGTVGARYLELQPMQDEEANILVLKAAEEPKPWSDDVKQSVRNICVELGFLPLALVAAAKAKLEQLVESWSDYLPFYQRQVKRIRERSRSRGRDQLREVTDNLEVFSTYEMLYRNLADSDREEFRDAVELLHLFSYFHFQNIRIDVFVHAATYPLMEAREREKEARKEQELEQKLTEMRQRTWSGWFRGLAMRLARYLDTPPPLPTVLRNPRRLDETAFEIELRDRLRIAVAVLVRQSLVMKQDRLEDRYCMHPLVHKWIRERPEMPTSQQAFWCEVATTTLASSILLPPLGDTKEERNSRRELLPHISHIEACRNTVQRHLAENRANRNKLRPNIEAGFGRHQALQAVRFSRVYSECGLFSEALKRQLKVREFAVQMLGEEHKLTIHITLFLVSTLWELSRPAEGTELQRRMYDICVKSLGQDHPLTLRVTDLLASSMCWKGRWGDALALHTRAVEGMRRIHGEDDENTLRAINNLRRVHLRYMEFEKAAELHQVAWKGLKSRLGETHVDTLVCLEDMAMARIRLGKRYYAECERDMEFVLEQRRASLGKEQPYTLLAMANLGRVRSAMGRHEDAAKIMEEALRGAERSLPEGHFGVLAGKTHYAQVLVHLGRFEEAEAMLYDVTEKSKYKNATDEDGEHPDRMIALWCLVGCLEKQGKFQEALDICNGLMVSLREIGGSGKGTKHKFATMVLEEIDKVEGMLHSSAKSPDSSHIVPEDL